MLGDRLKQSREAQGLTQTEVAKKFNISTSTIGMYEQGRRDPDTTILKQLAELYNVSTDYLLGRTESRGDEEALNKIRQALDEYDYSTQKRNHWKRFWDIMKDQKSGGAPQALPYIMRMLTGFLLVQNGVPPGVVTNSSLINFQGEYELNNESKLSLVELLDEVVNSSKIPILGTIQAGLPVLAEENIEDYVDVPEYIRADYALRVQGDSMIGAGILDGDLAICREVEVAQSGQIVVALKDISTGFSEATLKYYYEANGDGPVLRPANPQYREIPMMEGYRITGVMEALIREEAPSYNIYQNYLAANDSDEWTEIINEASAAGIKPSRMKSFIKMLQEMK